MVIDPRVLKGVPLFAPLSATDLEHLAERLRRRKYGRGATIFATGDPGTSLCLIAAGRVKLALTSVEGREAILDLLGPGDVFGELALLDGDPRSADAVAVDPTELLLLARDDFLRFLDERPKVAVAMLSVLSRRLRRDAELLQDAAFLDVPARLARAILRLAEAEPDGVTRTPKLVQSDLAGMAGTTRETLNKWLGLYEDQGLIRREEGRLAVLRPDELRRRIY